MQGKGKAIALVVVFALLIFGVWYMWHEPAPDTTPPAPVGGSGAPAPAGQPNRPGTDDAPAPTPPGRGGSMSG